MGERIVWISYRIDDGSGAASRRKRLAAAVAKLSSTTGPCWQETPAFFLLRSIYPLGIVASRVEAIIDMDTDLVVIGMVNHKGGWVIGSVTDRDVFDLVDFSERRLNSAAISIPQGVDRS